LTALPAGTASAADGDLAVQYRTSATGAVADQSEPWLKVRNTGSTTVPLSQVRIRYYFTADAPDAAHRFACSWAVRGCSAVTGTFGTPAHPTATADRYLEIGFTAAAGSLAPGADTGDMQLRFHRSTWQPLRQSDDHSFSGDRTAYADWDRVTAHLGGETVWGAAPGGDDPTDPTDPGGGRILFGDFDYASHTDPDLSAHGLRARSGSGGPRAPGPTVDTSRGPAATTPPIRPTRAAAGSCSTTSTTPRTPTRTCRPTAGACGPAPAARACRARPGTRPGSPSPPRADSP